MKNKVFVAVAAVLLVAGVFSAAYYLRPQAAATIDNVIPEGALVYLYQKNLSQLLLDFENSPFGKQLASIDVDALMHKGNVAENKIKMYENLFSQFAATVHNPLFQKMLGQEVAVAIYPFEIKSYDVKALMDLITHVTLVIRLDKETEFLEFLSRSSKAIGQEFVSQQVKYKNYPMTQFTVPQLAALNFKVSSTKIGQYLVLSFGEENVQSAIDVLKKKKDPLAKDKEYQSLHDKFIEHTQTAVYVQFKGLVDVLKGQVKYAVADLKKAPVTDPKEMEKIFAQFAGFRALAYTTVYSPDIQTKLSFSYTKDQLAPLVKDFYSCQAIPNNNIRFIPSNILMYQWNNCYDLSSYWENFKSEVDRLPPDALKEGPAPQEIIAGVEKLLKLSIEKDILPVLGREQGWVLADVESSGAFPIPKFLLFINVKDRSKAETVMTTLLDQPVLFVQDEDYKGIKINFVNTPISKDVQPAYCFLDNYLLIASSRQLLHDGIDASQDETLSLKNDVNFKSLNIDVTRPSNGLFFLHMDAFAGKVKKVIEWGSDWLMAKSLEVEAYKAGSQKRMTDLETEMAKTEEELKGFREQLVKYTNDRKGFAEQGADLSALDAQITDVQSQISSKEKVAALNQDRRQELQNIIESLSNEKSIDSEDLKFYLEKFAYPALKAFETIRVIGSAINIGEDYFDSITTLKMDNDR